MKLKISRETLEKVMTAELEQKGYKVVEFVYTGNEFDQENTFSVIADKEIKEEPAVVKPGVDATRGIKVSCGDIIRLKGTTEVGRSVIKRFGEWWKIAQLGNKPEEWYITSLPSKEQGKFRGTSKSVDVRWITKHEFGGDEHFKIIDKCPFPNPFNPKDYYELS